MFQSYFYEMWVNVIDKLNPWIISVLISIHKGAWWLSIYHLWDHETKILGLMIYMVIKKTVKAFIGVLLWYQTGSTCSPSLSTHSWNFPQVVFYNFSSAFLIKNTLTLKFNRTHAKHEEKWWLPSWLEL